MAERPEHDRHLHLGCADCRKAVSFSFHVDHPPTPEDRLCTNCGEPMEEIEHHPETGRLTHPAWEEEPDG